jgi:hypothetical protein
VTDYYQIDVRANTPELNAYVTLADNPNNQTYAWLIDPSGQAQAFQSNGVITADSKGNLTYTNTLGTNVHVVDPASGRWTLIVQFSPTVSGTALSEPFTVNLDEFPADVRSFRVPHGNSISAASPVTAYIRVTNTGTGPEAYFVDGRLNALTQYDLPALYSPDTTVPLNVSENIPLYLVPSETTAIEGTASTTGTGPIQFDMGAPTGDPDLGSGQGTSVSATLTGNPVTAGEYDLAPDVVGPFGPGAATPEDVATSLTATTEAFDLGVTSPTTGDLWQAAVGLAPPTVSPVVVEPGQTVTIPVTIAPTGGTAGTQVSGTLYLDDDSLFSLYGGLAPDANTVAAFPYSYTIAG